MLAVYSLTIFAGAFLLFLVQPLAARMVLPSLGGSPAVWNTCMVFFQGLLLAGYAYAHWSTTRNVRRQTALHLAVLLLPLAALPIALRTGPPAPGGSPIPWLLTALALSVGLPFLVVSSTAPLLQRWLTATGHQAGRDPYFLYAASNAGSLIALIVYPLVLEPTLTLQQQRYAWSVGYVVLAALTAWSAIITLRQPVAAPAGARRTRPALVREAVPLRRRLFWVTAAAVPSSYMLAVTQYLSTDIAAVPLLWVVPLALYLVTFIIAFASRSTSADFLSRILPLLTIGLAVALAMSAKRPVWLVIVLHLLTFFVAALLCHRRLAASRPGPARLTEFYLFIALGGVFGGMFNALLAPLIFRTIVEYPLVIVAACLFRVRAGPSRDEGRAPVNVILDIAIGGAMVLTVLLLLQALVGWAAPRLSSADGDILGLSERQFGLLLVVGVPSVIVYVLSRWPLRFAMGMAVLLWLARPTPEGRILHVERTFFGVYHVTDKATFRPVGVTTPHGPVAFLVPGPRLHLLVHGTTEHGAQFMDPRERAIPLTYYHPDGPIGQTFAVLGDRIADRAAFVGMGTGALAAYGTAGRHFTFYEIDPAIVRIAENPDWFTYLSDARRRGLRCDVVLGDGRLSLQRAPDGEFGLIVLDAFSSDAIPVHLLTLEATRIYLGKLRPGGVIAFHVSNVYLDLAPVVGRIAADLNLSALDMEDSDVTEAQEQLGRSRSHWIMLARDPRDFGALVGDRRWRPLRIPEDAPAWTDDYTSIVGIFRWK
ncbi:MAG: fused MFS/spermidine synthase [Phycisphaerales bacterium]|nr:fused MFS/spermidine synthase [Phycisphaerales bacterium]